MNIVIPTVQCLTYMIIHKVKIEIINSYHISSFAFVKYILNDIVFSDYNIDR